MLQICNSLCRLMNVTSNVNSQSDNKYVVFRIFFNHNPLAKYVVYDMSQLMAPLSSITQSHSYYSLPQMAPLFG